LERLSRTSLTSEQSSLAQEHWTIARNSVNKSIAQGKSNMDLAMEFSLHRKLTMRKELRKKSRGENGESPHSATKGGKGNTPKKGNKLSLEASFAWQSPGVPSSSSGGGGSSPGPGPGGGGDDNEKNKNDGIPEDGGGGGGSDGGEDGGGDSDEEEELEVNHTRLLYLISLYNRQSNDAANDPEGNASNVWVRKVPLMVLIYEGIVAGIFDYDYAPAPDIVDGKRVYMNISQEGRDDLDDLRETGMLYGLKLSSKKYQSTVALRITAIGEEHLRRMLTAEDRDAVHSVAYAPGESHTLRNLLKVTWESKSARFMLLSDAGYKMESTITEIESVSYVSSPYIPASVRKGGRENKQNADRVSELVNAVSTIKDQLDEKLTLNDVRLIIGEWIPMGANQIVALNDKLGSSERVQGGFFTSVVDANPDSSEFIGESEGLTEVDILDFDETAYVNFEAEVHYPEEDGIIQVENFGIHINDEGYLMYGLRCEGIMQAVKEKMSLDNLSRLLVDVQVDSSKIIDNLLSPHQRILLDLTYLNDAEHREKYNVIMCSRINKEGEEEMPAADQYMDKEANENELKQVIGDTHASYQLSPDDEVLIVGRNGMLLCSKYIERLEPLIVSYLSLMTRNMFMRSLFQRTFILADTLKHIRELIDTYESDPNSIATIRNLLSEASGDIILLSEIQSYLAESLQEVAIPAAPDDPAGQRLADILHIEATHHRLVRRVHDMKKNIEGARGEVSSLRSMADVVSEGKEFKVQEAVQNNTKNLEDVFRANERASASLEIMQIVLAGSLAFDIIDRLHGLYLGIAGDIDWANNAFGFIYETPGMLLLVNMAWWGVLGGFIQGLIKHLAEQAAGVMSIRYKINQRIDWGAFERFMVKMAPEVEDGDTDKNTYIKKFTWDEPDHVLWKGLPPRIEVTMDARYHYLLKAFLQISTKKSKMTQREAKVIFFRRMREVGVLNGVVPGLEEGEAAEEEAVRRKQAEVDNKKWAQANALGGNMEKGGGGGGLSGGGGGKGGGGKSPGTLSVLQSAVSSRKS